MDENFTRWQLDDTDTAITPEQRRRAWNRLRQLCRELDCDIPTLADIKEIEIALNAPETQTVLTDSQVLCWSRRDSNLVCLDFNMGYITGEEVKTAPSADNA